MVFFCGHHHTFILQLLKFIEEHTKLMEDMIVHCGFFLQIPEVDPFSKDCLGGL
jgi:hypothetical protein